MQNQESGSFLAKSFGRALTLLPICGAHQPKLPLLDVAPNGIFEVSVFNNLFFKACFTHKVFLYACHLPWFSILHSLPKK